jgi:hypothetical protein
MMLYRTMVCVGAVELGLPVHNEGASSEFLGLSEGAARVMLHLVLLASNLESLDQGNGIWPLRYLSDLSLDCWFTL